MSYDAEVDLGLVANDSTESVAEDNTEILNSALANMYPGGSFDFASSSAGPVLLPIQFAAKRFYFKGLLKTGHRHGGELIGAGGGFPLGQGEFGALGQGGAQTHFVRIDPVDDPDEYVLLLRNHGTKITGIHFYGRVLSGNINSGSGTKTGVGIGICGGAAPPRGKHVLTGVGVVDCSVGIKFLKGYYDDAHDFVPDENHADESTYTDIYIVGCETSVKSESQQAVWHNFRRLRCSGPADFTALHAAKGGLWYVTGMEVGNPQCTLLKLGEEGQDGTGVNGAFSPHNSRFDIHVQRDHYSGGDHRLTLVEYVRPTGSNPEPTDDSVPVWKDWDIRLSGNLSESANQFDPEETFKLNGLNPLKIWYDLNNLELVAAPSGHQWDIAGPWRRLVPDITSDLLLHYKLDETSGTTAVDSSGNGRHGTLVNGAAFHPGGKSGGAVDLDGTNDYVNAGTIAETDGASALTVAFWTNFTSRGNFERLCSKYADGSNVFEITLGGPGLGSNDQIQVGAFTGSVAHARSQTGPLAGNDGEWHHICVVFDGSATGNAGRLRIYYDAQPLALAFVNTIPATILDSSSDEWWFGWRSDEPGGLSAHAKLDDIRMYGRALSPAGVLWLYQQEAR